MTVKTFRKADYPIHSIYLNRWSPRAFSERKVEQEKLNSLFEAARWAPSAANWQPWNFIFAQSKEDRQRFLSFLNEGNVEWCVRVPVFVAVISKKVRNEQGDINPFHAFDTGTAWGFLALEAYRQGLITHGMGGFDRAKAKKSLNVPDEYEIQAIIAVGYHDPTVELSDENKEREKPSNRNPIESFVFEGMY